MIDNSTLVKIKSTVKAKNATISKNTGAIFSILTESVYANPRIAGVREIISNALDATTRAKSARPIEIKSPSPLDTSFSVRDYGNGLSEQEVEDLYTSLGASSKKEVEDEIGFFGIGALSPLAYVEQFTVQSFKDGNVDIYSIYAGDDGVPQVAKISSGKSKEPNGLKVSYNVKRDEITAFAADIISTLTYIPPERYSCPALQVSYYKTTLKTNKDLSISFNDNIFITKRGYSYNTKNIIIMGGVCYEFDSMLFKSALFTHHNLVIEAPIGAVSVQASREKLRMNAKTTAYIEEVLKFITVNLEKELQKQIDQSKTFTEACIIKDRMTIMQFPKMEWKGYKLCMGYLFEEMSKFFEVKRKYSKNFFLYGSPEYKNRFYSNPPSGHRLILDDTSKGGLVRVLGNDLYYDNVTVCVQKDSAQTNEFIEKFGNIFIEKTSNLPEPPKKIRTTKSKTKRYILNKGLFYVTTFNNCTSEFVGDYDKFDGYYVQMKSRSVIYNDKKISLSDLYDVRNFVDKGIMIIDWEEDVFPVKSSNFFDYFIKNIEDEKEKYWNNWIYEKLTYDQKTNILNKYRDDFKNGVSKFKKKSKLSSGDSGNGLIKALDLKTLDNNQWTDLCNKIHNKIHSTIKKNYPLLQVVNYEAYQDPYVSSLKKYILEGDQNIFEDCFR